jgi:hypothetical protein
VRRHTTRLVDEEQAVNRRRLRSRGVLEHP